MSVKTGDQFKEEQGFKDEDEAEPMSDGAPPAGGASAAAASATAGSASAQVRKLQSSITPSAVFWHSTKRPQVTIGHSDLAVSEHDVAPIRTKSHIHCCTACRSYVQMSSRSTSQSASRHTLYGQPRPGDVPCIHAAGGCLGAGSRRRADGPGSEAGRVGQGSKFSENFFVNIRVFLVVPTLLACLRLHRLANG